MRPLRKCCCGAGVLSPWEWRAHACADCSKVLVSGDPPNPASELETYQMQGVVQAVRAEMTGTRTSLGGTATMAATLIAGYAIVTNFSTTVGVEADTNVSPTQAELKAALESQFPGVIAGPDSSSYILKASTGFGVRAWGLRYFTATKQSSSNPSLFAAENRISPIADGDDKQAMRAAIVVSNSVTQCGTTSLGREDCATATATTATMLQQNGFRDYAFTLAERFTYPFLPDDYTYPAGALDQLPTLSEWKTVIGFPSSSAPAPLPFRMPPPLVSAAVLEERRFACFGDRHDGGCGRAVKVDGRHYCGACGCKRTPERSLEVRLADPGYACPVGEFHALTVAGRRVVG